MDDIFWTPREFAAIAADRQIDFNKLQEDIVNASSQIADVTAQIGYISPTGKTAMQLAVEQQGELEAQNRKQRIAESANFDELSVVLGQDLARLAMEQRSISQKIKEDSSVSLFDSPVDALINGFTLPWDRQALAGVNQQIATTSAAMNAVNNHVQASAQTAEAIKTKVTEASVADSAEKVELMAKVQAAQARLTASQTGAKSIQDALNMDHVRLQAYMSQRNLEMQEDQQRMAKERFARESELHKLQWQKYQDELQAEQEQLALINVARLEDGMRPLDISGLKRYKATSGKLLDTWLERGLIISGGGRASHGETLPEMMTYRASTGWKPETKAQETLMEMQGAALQQAASVSKDKQVIATESGKIFKQAFFDKHNNIKTDDQTNPFIAPAYSVYEQGLIGKSDLWKKYVAPTISDANRNLPVDPQRLVEIFSKAAVNKEIRPDQAAEFIADIYKTAIAVNNEHNKFYKVAGFEQGAYNTRIKFGPHTAVATLPPARVNMADPVIVKEVLVKKMVADLGFSMSNIGNSLGWPGYSLEGNK